MQLQLETCSICNAACLFCPYPTMKRQRGTMPMALYHKIINEAATIPHIESVTLTGLGEPLLDKHIIERIAYAHAKMPPHVVVDMFTNGSYLTPSKAVELRDAGLGRLIVSLNAPNATKRKAIMGLDDYDRVVEAVRDAIVIGGHRMQVKVVAVASKDLLEPCELDEFLTEWQPENQGGRARITLEGNWAGLQYPMRVKPERLCERAIGQIMILWDGRVSLCCFDGEGDVIFGDLNRQSIREVYNGEKALAYRTAHMEGRRKELPLCSNCTAI